MLYGGAAIVKKVYVTNVKFMDTIWVINTSAYICIKCERKYGTYDDV